LVSCPLFFSTCSKCSPPLRFFFAGNCENISHFTNSCYVKSPSFSLIYEEYDLGSDAMQRDRNLLAFRRNVCLHHQGLRVTWALRKKGALFFYILAYLCTMNIGLAGSSEMWARFYQTTRRHVPQDHTPDSHDSGNLKPVSEVCMYVYMYVCMYVCIRGGP
jgi:hypothetical protein